MLCWLYSPAQDLPVTVVQRGALTIEEKKAAQHLLILDICHSTFSSQHTYGKAQVITWGCFFIALQLHFHLEIYVSSIFILEHFFCYRGKF